MARFQEDLATHRAPVRADGAAEHRRPQLRLDARVRLEQARGHAQGALRLPVPEPRRGARVGADEGRALRRRTDANDRADPRGGGDAPVAAAARRVLPGDGRAGDRLGSDGSITHSIELLLVAVLLVMAGTLGLIFSGRPRLLPLGVALLAAALTFGALSVVGASLTMASIAVLPVLVGLAVDYAIQFQSRVEEAGASQGARRDRAPGDRGARPPLGGPTIATAGRRERGGDARAAALAGADGARLRRAARGGRGASRCCARSPRARRRWRSPGARATASRSPRWRSPGAAGAWPRGGARASCCSTTR